MKTTTELRNEQAAYYELCRWAHALEIPVALDDPRSPRTVAELEAAVNDEMRARARAGNLSERWSRL